MTICRIHRPQLCSRASSTWCRETLRLVQWDGSPVGMARQSISIVICKRYLVVGNHASLPSSDSFSRRDHSCNKRVVRRMPVLRAGRKKGGPTMVLSTLNNDSALQSPSSSSLKPPPYVRPPTPEGLTDGDIDEIVTSTASDPYVYGAAVLAMLGGRANVMAGSTSRRKVTRRSRDDLTDEMNHFQYFDHHCGIVVERIPRGALHFLIFPRNPKYQSLNHLSCRKMNATPGLSSSVKAAMGPPQTDLVLLDHMATVARRFEQGFRALPRHIYETAFSQRCEHHQAQTQQVTSQPGRDTDVLAGVGRFVPCPERLRFRVGFLSVPEIPMLVMEMVSMDFGGAGMKHPVTLNRYTTEFFLDVDRVRTDLARHGRVTINQDRRLKRLEEQPLRCPWCQWQAGNMKATQVYDVVNHMRTCAVGQECMSLPYSEGDELWKPFVTP